MNQQEESGGRRHRFAASLLERGWAPPREWEEHRLWEIVDGGVLGATRHLALSEDLLARILRERGTADQRLARARLAAEVIASTRGEEAPVIANGLDLLFRDLPGEASQATAELAGRLEASGERGRTLRESLVREATRTLGPSARILAFDYSSTVASIVLNLFEAGELESLVVPESRCIAGGRRYLEAFQPAGIPVHYLPDAALDYAISLSGCVLLGAESFHADGGFFNTVGSRPLAERARAAGLQVYAAVEWRKLDTRTYARPAADPPLRDFGEVLLGESGEAEPVPDTRCPELERIPPETVTALLTEEGPVRPGEVSRRGRLLFPSAVTELPGAPGEDSRHAE